jgi:tetratricopeptide (TPR) repeat protein
MIAVPILVAATGMSVFIGQELAIRGDADDARIAVEAGRYDEARRIINRWLDARPGSAEAHFLLARVALAEKRPDEIAEAFGKAQELGHDAEELGRLRGLLLVFIGRPEEAEPLLVAALERADGDDPEVAEALASVLLASYRILPAKVVLEHWMRSTPDDARPYLWMTEVDRRTQAAPPVLLGHYRAALDRDPTLDAARLGLARALLEASRHDEAAEHFAEYLERHPDDPDALVDAGRTALDRGELDDAARYLDAALGLSPGDAEALRERGVLDLRLGNPEVALDRLDAAVERSPFDREAWYHRAQALARVGRIEEAAGAQARSEDLLEDEQRLDALRKGLVRSPDDRDLQAGIASWLFDHGQPEEALRWTSLILKFSPDHAPTLQLLADYYSRIGDHGQANYYRMQAGSAVGGPSS